MIEGQKVTLDDLFNCAGWQATNRIGILAEMHNVFQQNYLELKTLFAKIHNDINMSSEVYKEVYDHLPQRIFNFLAASSAFIDQTRKMMSFYKDTVVYAEYENKKNETFLDNEYAQFVKDLRNYLTHFQIVYPHTITSVENNRSWDIVLLSEDLMKHSDQWSKKSKKFIKKCGKEIHINKVCYEYTQLIQAFYMWLYDVLKQYHKADFEEEKQLEKKLNIDTDALKGQLAKIVD